MKTETLTTLCDADLSSVTGGTFAGEGAFLTEALRRGLRGTKRSPRPQPRPHLKKSTTTPGWCDDGFGIVPCR